MIEEWNRWKPIEDLHGLYFFKSLITNMNTLSVRLESAPNIANHIIEIVFNHSVDAYRQTTEGFRINLFSNLSRNYESGFYGNWTFYRVTRSIYLTWLMHESTIHSNQTQFTHYVLMTEDSVLDIISRYEPIVKRINVPDK